jgi:ubiquinone/menaquinone biosynthesis C-methylase UbiE
MKSIEKYLSCVHCGGGLKYVNNYFVCVKCGQKYSYVNNILDCVDKMEDEKVFSQKKWDIFYKNWFKKGSVTDEYNKVLEMYKTYGVNQLKKYYKLDKTKIYLEIGCGAFIIGALVAKDCQMVVGIDFSMPALLAAQKILKLNKVKNYLLIRGDIFKIPLKDKTIDLLYGGGVIEHFKDTAGCIAEYGRVLKRRGVALNAVPYLNVGSLTYRQIWGNIPDFPLLKQLAEFVHIKVLRAKHMYFGYELSFTQSKLRRLHRKFGFSKIEFKRFETQVMMGFIPKFIRPAMVYLAEHCSWFWPMMMVVAKK